MSDTPRTEPEERGTVGSNRERNWHGRLQALADFVETYGRLPRSNARRRRQPDAAGERALAEWLRHQRRPQARERLSDSQRQLLEALPQFSWEPLDDAWDDRLDEYREFLNMERRHPRYRSRDAHERALAAWAVHQRQQDRANKLPYWRRSEFFALFETAECASAPVKRPSPQIISIDRNSHGLRLARYVGLPSSIEYLTSAASVVRETLRT